MTTIKEVREAARRLPPVEQFQLIQELLRGLERGYQLPGDAIPAGVRRAAPVTDLAELVADFWPEDETSDDINDYIAQQRAGDRLSDQ
jgi:hypothetical protein